VTTGIALAVGVGLGMGGAVAGIAEATPAGAAGAGSAGTKISVGTAAGVTTRATVCRVVRQVGRSRTAVAASKANPKRRFKRSESYRPRA
jgi:hypothetical protein